MENDMQETQMQIIILVEEEDANPTTTVLSQKQPNQDSKAGDSQQLTCDAQTSNQDSAAGVGQQLIHDAQKQKPFSGTGRASERKWRRRNS